MAKLEVIPRTFTLTLSEEEAQIIYDVFGQLSSSDADVTSRIAAVYVALNKELRVHAGAAKFRDGDDAADEECPSLQYETY